MLSSNKVDKILFIVAELDAVFTHFNSAFSCVLLLRVSDVILATDLILDDLMRCLNRTSMGGEKSLLLVENIRGSCQGVDCEPGFRLSGCLSESKIGIDACFLHDLHLVNVHNKKRVTFDLFSILINERKAVDAALHIVERLELKIKLIWSQWTFGACLHWSSFLCGWRSHDISSFSVRWLLKFTLEFLECHLSGILSENCFLVTD